MTWPGLIWKNLMRRRGRTALTSAGVAIGVGLIVALLSIAAGYSGQELTESQSHPLKTRRPSSKL